MRLGLDQRPLVREQDFFATLRQIDIFQLITDAFGVTSSMPTYVEDTLFQWPEFENYFVGDFRSAFFNACRAELVDLRNDTSIGIGLQDLRDCLDVFFS